MRRPVISSRAYARITLVAVAALTVIIVTGGAVRVTGSGLGCPEWPNCTSDSFLAPLDWHPMVEFINRIFTGVVSVAVMLSVLGAFFHERPRRDLTWLSLSLVLGVLGQALIGALSVHYKLMPQWVMAHFLLSMVLVWAALVLHHRAKEPDSRPQLVIHRQFLYLLRFDAVLAAIVLFVGTLVTGTGPHGGDADVRRLGFDPSTITRVHGTLVWVLIAVTVFTVWRLHVAGVTTTLIKRGEVLIGVMVLQGAIGYFQYAVHVPAGLVLVHIAGATAVWIAMVWFNLGAYERYGDVGLGVYDGDSYPGDLGTLVADSPE